MFGPNCSIPLARRALDPQELVYRRPIGVVAQELFQQLVEGHVPPRHRPFHEVGRWTMGLDTGEVVCRLGQPAVSLRPALDGSARVSSRSGLVERWRLRWILGLVILLRGHGLALLVAPLLQET